MDWLIIYMFINVKVWFLKLNLLDFEYFFFYNEVFYFFYGNNFLFYELFEKILIDEMIRKLMRRRNLF